jgi:excisionase family DNA binding protein
MILSIREVAQLLGRSEQAIYKLVARRQIPYRKLGKKVIFLKSEVERFLNDLPGLPLLTLTQANV